MALGVRFRDFVPDENSGDKGFEQLFKLFMQLITITSGDVGEALQWLNELDKQYGLTDDEYGMGNFIEDLKKKGYIDENEQERGELKITPKTEQKIRKSALEKAAPATTTRPTPGRATSRAPTCVSFASAIRWSKFRCRKASAMPSSTTAWTTTALC